ncbi:type I toxin-antitoxin system SymE family toxin [Enterobacter cloacae complex sp. ECC445]|uniref:SymE family type I addiction module toxin n=1 Tax=Enterobacter cloacae complex TaxID=354276 RepID=UPI00097C0137|nr:MULTISPECIES: SymE family type I addiction module toxin [Enterobacter cloacae complex]GJL40148.1 hypothetical protein TUM17577_13570 [Enterobacter asburiae]MBT1936027.1 type I toxin-antitoxin system SymE family toxin [Enterobacter chengduensis]MBT1963273.1 type I toxin-antitoxin system SymE family toxin [Enterobacter chengduensis]MCG0455719.1 type I toxin-antitoxin system SymE family toxin [Enterobacter cloacae complex sp. ECC445]MCK6818652.1 type I toxin-antitoxin system SymE family toxin 
MTTAKTHRYLKVGYFRKRHEIRNTKVPKRYSLHAALSLKGNWLEEAGFTTHSQVCVHVEHGKLLIELMEPRVD